jgi:hypothetical protein
MQRGLFIILLVITASTVNAQRPPTGLWTAVNMPVQLSTHWQWHNDGSYRTLGNSTAPLQYLYRPGIRYILNKKWNVASGVAFFFTKTDFEKSHHEFGKEFRLWQEGQLQESIGSWKLQFRLRTEQRFFEATSLKSKYTAHRFRLKATATKMLSQKWGLLFANEYMRQIKKRAALNFDQSRVIVSAIYQPTSTLQIQAGYMWLKWPEASQHILSITVIKNIKLYEQREARK